MDELIRIGDIAERFRNWKFCNIRVESIDISTRG